MVGNGLAAGYRIVGFVPDVVGAISIRYALDWLTQRLASATTLIKVGGS